VTYLAIFFAAFVYVMLRAFQQRNVAFDSYGWIVPTSYCMAVVDIFLVASFAREGWSWALVFWYGTAGAAGSLCAMWFHKKYVMRKKQ
jgi:hypothetical protein